MKKGFTLVEILAVLAIIGIGMGLFYSVFFLNWSSFEKQVTIIDLTQEADRVMELISSDVRSVSQIDTSEDNKTAVLTFEAGDTVTYTLTGQGQIQRNEQVLCENIDFNHSFFQRQGRSLVVKLLLADDVFGQKVKLPIGTHVFPRNRVRL